jgi:glycerol-3-phosphate cytidylyltransferase
MANKQIIVLACGVWDLFHIGHLNLLKNAKGLGDKLIVAVSTDECVEEWKKKKPVLSYSQRAEIVRNIKCVDCVVPQYTYDKTKLLTTIKPDILVAGDDWDKLKGQEVLEKMGGRVVFLPYTKTISTTELIQRIKEYGPSPIKR